MGYVYCLSNESFPGKYKIGKSKHCPHARIDNMKTGCLTNFILEFFIICDDETLIERMAHKFFFKSRVYSTKEFFDEPLQNIKEWFISTTSNDNIVFYDKGEECFCNKTLFKCNDCDKEYTQHFNLKRHNNGYNKCSFDKLKKELEELKVKQTKTVVNNITNNNTTQSIQNNTLKIKPLSSEDYLRTVNGLKKIDLNDYTINMKINELVKQIKDKKNRTDATSFTTVFNTVFNNKTIGDSIVIRDRRRSKVDIKYGNVVKEFSDHADLHCDIYSVTSEAISRSNGDDEPKTTPVDIYKCKRNIIKNHKDKTLKTIKGGQVVSEQQLLLL